MSAAELLSEVEEQFQDSVRSFHNQRRLKTDEEVQLEPGDEIRFGDCHGVFADVGLLETLCTYLRSQSR